MKHIAIRLLEIAAAAGLTGILVLPACAVQTGGDEGETQSTSDASGIPLVRDETSVKKSILDPPATFVSWVEIGSGSWGSWSSIKTYCSLNSYAYTAWVRAESAQGEGHDDTAMNALWMQCFDKTTGAYTGPLFSSSGSWGTDYPTGTTDPFTTANPFIGGRMKIEPSQGGGDDTAANVVGLLALNGHETQPQAPTGWGSWNRSTPSQSFKCPTNTAVCGLQTRVEPSQGNSDDTALNGIRLACCTF